MKRTAILFLGTQMAVGGAQRVLFSQADWFHNVSGYRVLAAFFYDKENLSAIWKAGNPYPVINLNARDGNTGKVRNIFLLFAGLWRLFRLLREEEIEIIETFTPDANMMGMLVARLARVPVRIASYHGVIEGRPLWIRRAHSWMINRGFADILVAVSKQVERIAIEEEGLDPARVEVILNGIVPLDRAENPAEVRKQILDGQGIQSASHVILAVGRVTNQKGHTYLLDAVPKVLAQFPEAVFLIAGDGPLKDDLIGKAVRLGIDDNIRFLGTRSDIPELLTSADLFVLPSLSEGMPIALLEAMSMGVPVIASDLDQIAAFLRHGEQGLLVSPADADALGRAVELMLADQAKRLQIGKAGQDLVLEKYSIDRMCEAYHRLFTGNYEAN